MKKEEVEPLVAAIDGMRIKLNRYAGKLHQTDGKLAATDVVPLVSDLMQAASLLYQLRGVVLRGEERREDGYRGRISTDR